MVAAAGKSGGPLPFKPHLFRKHLLAQRPATSG